MKIESISDIETISAEMHDSELSGEDFGFDAAEKKFFLRARPADDRAKEFYVEFHHVEYYEPRNLERVKNRRATAGVFDNIRVRHNSAMHFLVEILQGSPGQLRPQPVAFF